MIETSGELRKHDGLLIHWRRYILDNGFDISCCWAMRTNYIIVSVYDGVGYYADFQEQNGALDKHLTHIHLKDHVECAYFTSSFDNIMPENIKALIAKVEALPRPTSTEKITKKGERMLEWENSGKKLVL